MIPTETVTIIRPTPGGKDKYGNRNTSTDDTTEVEDCLVSDRGSDETDVPGRSGVVTGWTVYAPPGTEVLRTDLIEIRGVRCKVDGEVAVWHGARAGVVINAIRAAG